MHEKTQPLGLRPGEGICLVDLPETVHHLGQLCGLQRLDRHFDHRRGGEAQGLEDLDLKAQQLTDIHRCSTHTS